MCERLRGARWSAKSTTLAPPGRRVQRAAGRRASTTNRVVHICPVASFCFWYIHYSVYCPRFVPSHQR